MIQHELKTDPIPFEDVWNGRKTFEIRKDDRGFQEGDVLYLRETSLSSKAIRKGQSLEYTGREMLVTVKHKLKGYGVKRGWCAMSIYQFYKFGV